MSFIANMLRKLFLLLVSVLNLQPGQKCTLHPQMHFRDSSPVVLKDGKLIEPTEASGNVVINQGETITLSCNDAGAILHPNTIAYKSTATVTCDGGELFKNEEWLSSPSAFSYFSCSFPPSYTSTRTNRTCFEGNAVYEVGYQIEDQFYPSYETCFNEDELNPIYSKYTQKAYNYFFKTKVQRPYFQDNNVYSRSFKVPVNSLFSPRGQRDRVAQLVGAAVNNYFVKPQELTRGHLAAKTDFVFPVTERATFHYVNCAPQWYGFNGGNWNTLEVDLRLHVHNAGYSTIIYTGTYGVTELRNDAGNKVPIYLYTDMNNNPVLPVPMYFYKVVYEPRLKKGIAYVGINNPYYSVGEMERLVFCKDQCRNNPEFSWLTWSPDSFGEGYTFCCTIPDFARVIRHLPSMEVNGLLT